MKQFVYSDKELNIGDLEDVSATLRWKPKRYSATGILQAAAIFLSLLLNVYLVLSPASSNDDVLVQIPHVPGSELVSSFYTPAQSAIKYENRPYLGFGEITRFHGPPTDDTDDAWNTIYPVGMTRITAEQESRMANWTSRIPGDEEHYIISLDFFHQMHCLNLVRKALWPEKYGPMELGDPVLNDVPFDHVDHCVNIIRENLMCNADITPNVYRWDADRQVAIPHFDVLHTCRSLDSINQWAVEHQLLEKWDPRKPLGTGS